MPQSEQSMMPLEKMKLKALPYRFRAVLDINDANNPILVKTAMLLPASSTSDRSGWRPENRINMSLSDFADYRLTKQRRIASNTI